MVALWGQIGVECESSMFCPDKSRPPTNENGESFVETVGAASGNTQFNEIVKEATELGLSIGKKFGGKQIRSNVPKVKQQVEILLNHFGLRPGEQKENYEIKRF